MDSTFSIEFSDHKVFASVTSRPKSSREIRIHHMMIHHSQSRSLTDLVLKTDDKGNPQILDRHWNPISTKEHLHTYWPTGWRNLKSIIWSIEKAMESELFFTRAISALA